MNKRKMSLILNILIIIFEILGFIVAIKENGRLGIEYYTEDSNILALITSIIFVIYILFNKKIPSYLRFLKYASCVCLAITFFVVIIILAPMYNFNYSFLLFHNELLYHHLLCPLLCILSFILFDGVSDHTLKDNIFVSLVTVFYGVILIFLNILKIVDGPYPFLKIYNQPMYLSIFWIVLILGISFLVAFVIRIVNNKLIRSMCLYDNK